MFRSLPVISCLFLIGCGSSSPMPPGTVSGVVLEVLSDAVVPGVTVEVAGVSAVTDGEGKFIIRGVPVGEHRITVTTAGWIIPPWSPGTMVSIRSCRRTVLDRPIYIIRSGDLPPSIPV